MAASRGPHDENDALARLSRDFGFLIEETREKLTPSPKVKFELRRKAIHVLTAVLAVPFLLFFPLWVTVAIGAVAIVLMTAAYLVERRRLLVVSPVAEVVHETVTGPIQLVLRATRRPGESYPWSPVLYTVSILVTATGTSLLGIPFAFAFAAYAILGLGDTASALYGIAYGRNHLPWNRKKSWEGMGAGIVVGFIGAVLFASADYAYRGEVFPLALFGVLAVGAIVGMVAESLPRVQDNLVIPLSAWGAMVGLAFASGLA